MIDKKLFIFGLGFTAQEIARTAMARGYKVSGTCRSAQKCEELKNQGINAFVFDKIPAEIIANSTHILSSIPPQETGDIILPLLPATSNQQPVTKPWLGYLSTTGVYGDYAGEWVSEESETHPNNARLQRRVEAEKQWQEIGGHIFRLAGIYGAGRSVLDDIMAGTARRVEKAGQVFSRIHVEDIAEVVLASMKALKNISDNFNTDFSTPNDRHPALDAGSRDKTNDENCSPRPRCKHGVTTNSSMRNSLKNCGRIYNVCDDEPAPAHEVVKFGCELLGKEIPPLIAFAEADFSPMGREFYSANRRVSNQRIKRELGLKLKYPTYREGLRALFSNSLNR